MRGSQARGWVLPGFAAVLAVGICPAVGNSACCYFSAKDKDIQQPGQKVFITWDAQKQIETFTVQPRFEGNARDFGMVIPTPSKPKLDEMPRDFFKELAVFTILKRRDYAISKLLWQRSLGGFVGGGLGAFGAVGGLGGGMGGMAATPRQPAVKVVEAGVVGSLDYKILTARRGNDLYTWLKDNKYHYEGDEATLDFYVKKGWYFTVMKIDTMQMKKKPDGSFFGEVTPTRFQFASRQLIYPLKITQLSVKEQTEALFYVQTSYKVDLPGEMTYQYQWVPLLQSARNSYGKESIGTTNLPGKGDAWLRAIRGQMPELLRKADDLGFAFTSGQRPSANDQGRIPTTLEWAKQLTAADLRVLTGKSPYGEEVPDVDKGFTEADFKDDAKAKAAARIIQERLAKSRKERPGGYLAREAPPEDVRQLKILVGHLQEGQFLTKFRKIFTRGEMNADLLIVPARLGSAVDHSEYEEILPTSPP